MQSIEEVKNLVSEEGNGKTFSYRGIECEIIRSEAKGHLCGYLHIDVTEDDVECCICDSQFHGGVTYNKEKVGFDCAHAGDMVPLIAEDYLAISERFTGVYRTMQYVEDILKEAVDRILEYRNENQEDE